MVLALVFYFLWRGIACLFIFLFLIGIHLFLHVMLLFSLTAALGRGSSPGFSGSFFERGWVAGGTQVKLVGGFCRMPRWRLETRD